MRGQLSLAVMRNLAFKVRVRRAHVQSLPKDTESASKTFLSDKIAARGVFDAKVTAALMKLPHTHIVRGKLTLLRNCDFAAAIHLPDVLRSNSLRYGPVRVLWHPAGARAADGRSFSWRSGANKV